MAVDDRLRQAGRARGEEHVQRVVERHRLELERRRPRRASSSHATASGSVVRPRYGTWTTCRATAGPRGSRRPARAGRPRLLAVAVAVDGEQHGRLELAEPVDHAARRRTPARRSPRPRRGSRSRGTRRASRGCSAGTRRRGRRGRRRAAAARRARARPGRAARRRSARTGRGTASGRRPRLRRCPRRGRACARRSSAARPGTTRRRASRASRARARTACRARISKKSQIEAQKRLEVGHRPAPELLVRLARAADRRRVPREQRVLARVLVGSQTIWPTEYGPIRGDAHG